MEMDSLFTLNELCDFNLYIQLFLIKNLFASLFGIWRQVYYGDYGKANGICK